MPGEIKEIDLHELTESINNLEEIYLVDYYILPNYPSSPKIHKRAKFN